jgi:hypothetical protein
VVVGWGDLMLTNEIPRYLPSNKRKNFSSRSQKISKLPLHIIESISGLLIVGFHKETAHVFDCFAGRGMSKSRTKGGIIELICEDRK